jgi:preprotein translocase subunit SecG
MTTVLLVVHILIALAMIVVVLMQRSEGGALGIGGGGSGGGFLTGRGQANLLTRITAVLAVCFFASSIMLTIIANQGGSAGSLFQKPAAPAGASTPAPSGPQAPTSGDGQPAPSTGGGILDDLSSPTRNPLPAVPGSR